MSRQGAEAARPRGQKTYFLCPSSAGQPNRCGILSSYTVFRTNYLFTPAHGTPAGTPDLPSFSEDETAVSASGRQDFEPVSGVSA